MAAIRKRQLNIKLSPLDISKPQLPLPLSLTLTLPLPPTFTTTGINIAAADLEKICVLGHGNGGTVYKVKHKKTSELYALKLIHVGSNEALHGQTLQEIEIHRSTNSPYVVRFHEVYEQSDGDVCILMEYMERGSLHTLMKNNSEFFTESTLSNIANQMVKGLKYLHDNKIVHRDIKPSNFLVNDKMEIKIADFGVSCKMTSSRTLERDNSYVGTCAYMSPERLDSTDSKKNFDVYAGDVWSVALTILELYTGHYPLLPKGQTPDWAILMCAICFGELSLPTKASAEFINFVQCCLDKDSSKRWSASQLLCHPFVCKDL
ncbi:hypothetical protein ACFE04_004839 [Oxalis oulophora]